MKQIKTIIKVMNPRLDAAMEAQAFDDEVNAALEEGWTLVKREVLAPAVTDAYDYHRTLYAELERELVEEREQPEEQPEERECGNCRYYGTAVYDYPCTVCTDSNKWEPEP